MEKGTGRWGPRHEILKVKVSKFAFPCFVIYQSNFKSCTKENLHKSFTFRSKLTVFHEGLLSTILFMSGYFRQEELLRWQPLRMGSQGRTPAGLGWLFWPLLSHKLHSAWQAERWESTIWCLPNDITNRQQPLPLPPGYQCCCGACWVSGGAANFTLFSPNHLLIFLQLQLTMLHDLAKITKPKDKINSESLCPVG